MRAMLDTCAYSGFLRGDEVVARVVRRSERVVLPAPVVGELLYGFRAGTRFEENRDQLESFLGEPFVEFHPVTRDTCRRYGDTAARLRRAGTPIPQNDLWIAACALETGADLVTYDGHFERVAGLALVLFST